MKKLLGTAIAGMMALSLLAGCGNGKSPQAESSAVSSPIATASSAADVGGQTEKKPEDYKGEITVWTWWKPYFDESIADFNKTYPNVKVNLTVMGWGDYVTKFETAKASGGELPDVAMAESYWWGRFLSYKNTFVDLTTVGFKKTDIADAASNAVVDPDGKFVAIPQGLGLGAIWYRKDLAKEVFGTDDPAAIAGKYASMEDFILNAGKEVKEKSGGKLTAFTNATDVMEGLIASQVSSGKSYVDGDTLKVKENMTSAFQTLDKALKEGYIAKVNGPAMDAAWASGKVVFFPSAGWREGTIPANDKDGKGRWGVFAPPGGAYFRGGTAELIVDKGDPEKAKLAALFIKHRMFTEEGMKVNNKFGNLSAVKEIEQKKLTNGVNDYFGLDITAYFYDVLSKMKPVKYGKHDSVIEDQLKAVALDMEKSGLEPEKAVEKAISAIKSKDDSIQ
ncbi:ABC transporter substrate-binding protein [Cohnella sp. CFH 77786]|uniref:ABC transporter substrate-binding protein n=1 Tax=Cohnella sp. CFH 77786 TaxID=2662265 RepID=UPI002101DE81|nr:extracellular solute-binding protein [Cohnella sp. CFH 77786]